MAPTGLLCLAVGVVLALSVAALAPAAARAQSVVQVVRAEVPIYDDNLDDAKSRAVRKGQLTALRSAIGALVAEEWIQLFDKELRQRVLNRLNRYLTSFRVQKQETSIDRTRYRVVLAAQVNRSRLTQDLQNLPLPVRGDPVTAVAVLYGSDDPVLRDNRLRDPLLQRLRERLALLNYRLAGVQALPPRTAALLANPASDYGGRVQALGRFEEPAALFLRFERTQDSADADGIARGHALLYEKDSGRLAAQLEHLEREALSRLPARTGREREAVLAKLVQPLILQMQPGAIRPVRTSGEGSAVMRLRVLGLTSVAEQEGFERAFFKRNTPFERFSLYALAPRAVTYEGPYGGDRTQLAQRLRTWREGAYAVQRVYWYNELLEIDVRHSGAPEQRPLRLFPKEVRAADVSEALDDYLTRYSQLEVEDPHYAEVEDNGWLTRANQLAFNVTVYGFTDTRSDSDFYVGEALRPGEKITLIWHRVGRTHLSPSVRLYDAQGVLVRSFHPRSWLRYEYTVPKGQHRFYVEIADRFGHLKVDTGGYLSFHYLFTAQRAAH